MKKKNIPTDQELYDIAKNIVKSRVKVWPSAYASGQLVTEYKRLFSEMYGESASPYNEDIESIKINKKPNAQKSVKGTENTKDANTKDANSALNRWFDEVWVNVCEKDKNNNFLPCGRSKARLNQEDYPYCRPLYRITEDTPKTALEFSQDELDKMCSYKRSKKQGIKQAPTRIYHEKVLK